MTTSLQLLKRQCQDIGCNLCCDLPAIKSLKKPVAQLCEHHNGECCKIYETRPEECRAFDCQWRLDSMFPLELDPVSTNCYAEVVRYTHEEVVPARKGKHPLDVSKEKVIKQEFAQVNIHEVGMGAWRGLMPWLVKVWTLYPTKGVQPAITVYSGSHWRSLVLLPNGSNWEGHIVARGKLNPMKPIHDAPLVTPDGCQAMMWHLPSIKRAIRKSKKKN